MKPDATDTVFAFTWGGAVSVLAYLIGGVDNLTTALGIFMLTDYLTGWLSALYLGNVHSRRMYMGLTKKTGALAFIIVANQVDIISGNGTGFIRDSMCMFLIGMEGISILENTKKLGYEPPSWFLNTFRKVTGADQPVELGEVKVTPPETKDQTEGM